MTFREFESLEAMFEAMRVGTDLANDSLAPEQQAITWGDYWVRFYDIPDRMLIFGHIFSYDDFVAGERKHYPKTMNAEERSEFEYTIANRRENHDRGYLFGWAYSYPFPDGDLGDTHRANMWPISKELYEHAKEKEWRMDDFDTPFKVELQEAFDGYHRHAMATGYTHGD